MACVLVTCVARYKSVKYLGRTVKLHRLVYAQAHGLDVLTMGGSVMHSCDNTRCINPDHLTLGTHVENMLDKQMKGRAPKGEAHACALYSDAAIAAMRQEYIPRPTTKGSGLGRGNKAAIMQKYGISSKHLDSIIKGVYR